MQNAHLPLKEIIWEITGKCKNNCRYCGSKEGWNQEINKDDIKKIIDSIALYPPEEINISGGDPLLIDLATHEYLVTTLKEKNVKVKIIINPKSFHFNKTNNEYRNAILDEQYKIIRLYDWIGISINDIDEINAFINHWIDYDAYHPTPNCTIISNFNLSNVFIFDQIKKIVKDRNLTWQVQFTMFQDPNNLLALYNPTNKAACDFFFDQIQIAIEEGIMILPADNMNNGTCGAGNSSLGILSNGDVIPCLSMRSWKDDTNACNSGNILKSGLKFIWESGFDSHRFNKFECCKDFCNNKCFIFKKQDNIIIENIEENFQNKKVFPIDKNTYLYGVKTPNIMMYAVQTSDIMVYAVQPSLTTTNNPYISGKSKTILV